jgi:hypothetical protein
LAGCLPCAVRLCCIGVDLTVIDVVRIHRPCRCGRRIRVVIPSRPEPGTQAPPNRQRIIATCAAAFVAGATQVRLEPAANTAVPPSGS